MDHFIETVRQYPCLWKTTAIEYRDQELKDAAWAEVMKETDLSSVKEVKLKWKKLRDSYRDALKRQSEMLTKDPCNQIKKSSYPWKYTGAMHFLQPYMSNRKKPADSAPPLRSGNGHAPHGSSDRSDSTETESEWEPPAPPPPKRQHRERRPSEAPEPLDIFFNSMCQSTKRLPHQAQIKIKRTLFEAVMEGEASLLVEQQSYTRLWASGAASESASEEPDVKLTPC